MNFKPSSKTPAPQKSALSIYNCDCGGSEVKPTLWLCSCLIRRILMKCYSRVHCNHLFLCEIVSLKSSKIAMIEIDDVDSMYKAGDALDPARVL